MKSPPACPRRCWTSEELSAIRKVPARCLGREGQRWPQPRPLGEAVPCGDWCLWVLTPEVTQEVRKAKP